MSLPIKISVTLSPKQTEIFKNFKRFNIVRAARGFGKTYLGVYYLLKFAITHPNTLSWYVASDISTCTELIMPEFEKMCPPELIKFKNRQTRTFTLFNGARIVFKTGETRDALRGRTLDLCVLEEVAFWKNGRDLWWNVLRPQLLSRGRPVGGKALFITSPNGNNWFRQLEAHAEKLIKNGDIEWTIGTASIHDNPMVTKEEIETTRKTVPEENWLQEYEGLYAENKGLVHWEFNRVLHSIPRAPDTEPVIRVRGMDWGLSDETACVWMSARTDGTVYVYDEYSQNGLDPAAHARTILQMTDVPVSYSILDASCWNRDASLTSVAKRFHNAGIPVMPATQEFDVSVTDLKALFSENKIFINDKCRKLMNALETWQYDQHEPDVLAAFRYGVSGLIKAGKIMAPVRVAKPRTFADVLREDAKCEARRRACERNRNSGLSFKVYNI